MRSGVPASVDLAGVKLQKVRTPQSLAIPPRLHPHSNIQASIKSLSTSEYDDTIATTASLLELAMVVQQHVLNWLYSVLTSVCLSYLLAYEAVLVVP
jgi:hypothetical protein